VLEKVMNRFDDFRSLNDWKGEEEKKSLEMRFKKRDVSKMNP
jgi:hypothetical protein